jgi:hypothetical protein
MVVRERGEMMMDVECGDDSARVYALQQTIYRSENMDCAKELATVLVDMQNRTAGLEAKSGNESLRDQFAMAALTALGQSFCQEWRNPNDVQIKLMADGAYKIADAMLAARGGK